MPEPSHASEQDDAPPNICGVCEIVIPAPFTICAACHEYPSRTAGQCVRCGGTAPAADALCWACAGQGQMPLPFPRR